MPLRFMRLQDAPSGTKTDKYLGLARYAGQCLGVACRLVRGISHRLGGRSARSGGTGLVLGAPQRQTATSEWSANGAETI